MSIKSVSLEGAYTTMVSITLLSPTMQGVRNASLEQIIALVDAAFSAHREMEKSLGEADAAKEIETLRKVLAEKSQALNDGMIKIAHDMHCSLIIDETRGLNQAASELVPRQATADLSAASDQAATSDEMVPLERRSDRDEAIYQGFFAQFMRNLPPAPTVSRAAVMPRRPTTIGLRVQQQRDLERGEQLRLQEESELREQQDQLERERTELSLLKQREEREQRERERLERGTPLTYSEIRDDKCRLRNEQHAELRLKLIGRSDRSHLLGLFQKKLSEEDERERREQVRKVEYERRAQKQRLNDERREKREQEEREKLASTIILLLDRKALATAKVVA